MGSPSIEIQDIENVWIYLFVSKEKVFDEDELLFQIFIDLNLIIVEY